MTHAIYINLLDLCDAYAAHLNLSHWRVSFLVRGDGQFFKRLRAGGGCTVTNASNSMQWFSDNWPDAELVWPEGIPRPAKSRQEAA